MYRVIAFETAKIHMLTVGAVERDVNKFPLTTPLSYRSHGETRWCLCECGKSCIYPTSLLEKGNIKSCGCLKAARAANRLARVGNFTARKKLKAQASELVKDLRKAEFAKRWGEYEAIGSHLREVYTELEKLK